MITTILIILWIICGILSFLRVYYGMIANWYYKFNEDYRDTSYYQPIVDIGFPLIMGLVGGILSLVISLDTFKKYPLVFYFKIPKK